MPVKNGEVTSNGAVDHTEMKRVAEEATENLSGVKEVHNQLKVQHEGVPSQQTQHKS